MKTLQWIALTLVIIGAINLGMLGLFGFDIIATVFGGMSTTISRFTYVCIGLAGIYALTFYGLFRTPKTVAALPTGDAVPPSKTTVNDKDANEINKTNTSNINNSVNK